MTTGPRGHVAPPTVGTILLTAACRRRSRVKRTEAAQDHARPEERAREPSARGGLVGALMQMNPRMSSLETLACLSGARQSWVWAWRWRIERRTPRGRARGTFANARVPEPGCFEDGSTSHMPSSASQERLAGRAPLPEHVGMTVWRTGRTSTRYGTLAVHMRASLLPDSSFGHRSWQLTGPR